MNKVFDGKFIKLYNNDGWTFASRKELETPSSDTTKPDAVCIWASHIQTNRVVVVRQFRKSINDWVWELPAGLVDKGESLIQAAKRELFEETGLTLVGIKDIIGGYPSIGLTDEYQAIIRCEVHGELSTANLQENEQLTIHMWDEHDFRRHRADRIDGRLAMIFLTGSF